MVGQHLTYNLDQAIFKHADSVKIAHLNGVDNILSSFYDIERFNSNLRKQAD